MHVTLNALALAYVVRPLPTLSGEVARAATSRAVPVTMMVDPESSDFDMSLLASRIKDIRSAPKPESVRLFNLDSMCPGQCLEFDIPQAFADTLEQLQAADTAIVMVGRDRLRLLSHGVECTVERLEKRSDGSAAVALVAGRYCEIVDVGEDEGSRWLGQAGTVRWKSLDGTAPEEQPTPAVVERAEALEALVVEWIRLVRTTGRERQPGQIERVLQDIGPIPEATRPSARALWIAGLINPLPGLGVALEIRPACLTAETADMKLQVIEMGIKDSIERLKQAGAPF